MKQIETEYLMISPITMYCVLYYICMEKVMTFNQFLMLVTGAGAYSEFHVQISSSPPALGTQLSDPTYYNIHDLLDKNIILINELHFELN